MKSIIMKKKNFQDGLIFTKHFHQRILDRYGVVLTDEELSEIRNKILATRCGVGFSNGEHFDVILHHKKIKFCAVFQDGKIVTAHANKPMPRKKFLKKWNLGHIKKN